MLECARLQIKIVLYTEQIAILTDKMTFNDTECIYSIYSLFRLICFSSFLLRKAEPVNQFKINLETFLLSQLIQCYKSSNHAKTSCPRQRRCKEKGKYFSKIEAIYVIVLNNI